MFNFSYSSHSHIYNRTQLKGMLVFLSLLFSSIGTSNPPYYFKQLDINNGLSQNTVLSILQDRRGFMWFGTRDGLNRYDGISFKVFNNPNAPDGLGNNVVNALYEDEEENIWIGTDHGVYIYSPISESFKKFDQLSTSGIGIDKPVYKIIADDLHGIWFVVEHQGIFKLNGHDLEYYSNTSVQERGANINCFFIDKHRNIWLGFYEIGLWYSTDELVSLKEYTNKKGEKEFLNDNISRIQGGGKRNSILIGSSKNGLKEIDLGIKKTRDLLANQQPHSVYVRDVLNYTADELWVGTETGLYIVNSDSKAVTRLLHAEDDRYSISDNAIYCVYKDREEGVWIGTFFGGINYYPKQFTYFEKYYPLLRSNSLNGKRVREFCEDHHGNLWIGTEDGGLNCFDPVLKTFNTIVDPRMYSNVHGLCVDRENNLWIGYFANGLHVKDLKTGELKHYKKEQSPNSLIDNNVFCIYQMSSGELWIGTLSGLCIYNKVSDDFTAVEKLKGLFVHDIYEDSKGDCWITTYSTGVYRYSPKSGTWKNYRHEKTNPGSLPYDKVISVYEDSKKQLWFTTLGRGFCKFDPATETFFTYHSNQGFPSNVVYRMMEDDENTFWLTTNNGLVHFNEKDTSFRTYTKEIGLLCNQFNFRSGIKLNDGKIYFGCIDGFIAFAPETITKVGNVPPIVLTDFLLFNKPVPIGTGSPLAQSMPLTKQLILKHNQNIFTLKFAALSYTSPETNQYEYKLEGFDKEWYKPASNLRVNYSNLQPGNYTFKVRTSNGQGEWVEGINLPIEIQPPYWESPYAYALYALLAFILLYWTVNFSRRRVLKKELRRTELLEAKKEREIYHAKIEFFTSIAHEIRTPLTLINGPLESIIDRHELPKDIKGNLDIMAKNTSRLLGLVNQLLDFRKTEVENFSLNFVRINISALLSEIYTQFQPAAMQYGIDFEIALPAEDFHAPVDKETLTKIVSNLLSNALKYAQHVVLLKLVERAQDPSYFMIMVNNDGEMIPPNMHEKVFQPFVQIKGNEPIRPTTGTGLGLALARSLTELHTGRLYIDASQTEFNSFCLLLPNQQENEIVVPSSYSGPTIVQENTTDLPNKPCILAVDDNPEILVFLVSQLKDSYNTVTAHGGAKALEVLNQTSVNLILSDVIMPEPDGFELCRLIKSDVNYSHIPVILLTAKATLESKIKGMELGADAYIEKPFSPEYLLTCIANLLDNREKLRQSFANSPFTAIGSIALTAADQVFLDNVIDAIHKDLVNVNFNVDHLAGLLNMSRSSLHRKIKGLSGLTPNDFIKLERLKKAAHLIREKKYQISEVCYIVGFSSPSYFSKCFHKQFGVLPKDFS